MKSTVPKTDVGSPVNQAAAFTSDEVEFAEFSSTIKKSMKRMNSKMKASIADWQRRKNNCSSHVHHKKLENKKPSSSSSKVVREVNEPDSSTQAVSAIEELGSVDTKKRSDDEDESVTPALNDHFRETQKTFYKEELRQAIQDLNVAFRSGDDQRYREAKRKNKERFGQATDMFFNLQTIKFREHRESVLNAQRSHLRYLSQLAYRNARAIIRNTSSEGLPSHRVVVEPVFYSFNRLVSNSAENTRQRSPENASESATVSGEIVNEGTV